MLELRGVLDFGKIENPTPPEEFSRCRVLNTGLISGPSKYGLNKPRV